MINFISLLGVTAPSRLVSLGTIDILVIAVYFAFVLGIGFYLKRFAKTGEDFFMAGRDMTAWIAGLAFVSANLGSLELLGWASASYQYGILGAHWYWIGAIPAILFLALLMMPFYYICKTHSVPGYLQLRFGGGARGVSAVSFAFMTILMSGVNMYSMAIVMQAILGWDIHFSIWVSSLTVAGYVVLGGLLSAIFNEVLQFMLIWFGALLIPILGLIECHGWSGMVTRIQQNWNGQNFTHLWTGLDSAAHNPMGIHWTGIVFGLGAVISMGYWTTDFLVVQRVMTAKDLRAAKMAPLIGGAFKMLVPFIVILPGLLGLAVLTGADKLIPANEIDLPGNAGKHTYDQVLPIMLARYCGPGLLGLGITALVAGFMSGMAGNISAFATVWTYDIYRPMIKPNATDKHYVNMGRWCTILGVLVSIGTAYLCMQFKGIMDYVQALFSFFIAPLFGTVLLGMFWKRATNAGGFWGLLAGTLSSIGMWLWVNMNWPIWKVIGLDWDATAKVNKRAMELLTFSPHAKPMAENMYRALWSFAVVIVVTVIASLITKPRSEKELVGLVRGCTEIPSEGNYPWYQRPLFWGAVVFAAFLALNLIFW